MCILVINMLLPFFFGSPFCRCFEHHCCVPVTGYNNLTWVIISLLVPHFLNTNRWFDIDIFFSCVKLKNWNSKAF
ncbi:hypothetical protein VNO80_08397 [Phaseolus coccineus]|uniref:Uncharacterized protein n=1 Tax=Phaseolus coccineus TaxID=3886 RepID=A0AAN9NKG2_PHACN